MDPLGNYFLAGCFTDQITIAENITMNGSALSNQYLAKFDEFGDLSWAVAFHSMNSKYYNLVRFFYELFLLSSPISSLTSLYRRYTGS